ncbi:MAG: hypothetical protein AB1921_05690 [Thermodesulfobacteriota bacterium]
MPMRRCVGILAALALLSVNACSSSSLPGARETPDYIRDLISLPAARAMYLSPPLWPGYTWQNRDTYYADPELMIARLVKSVPQQSSYPFSVEEFPYADLPPAMLAQIRAGRFWINTLRGRQAGAVSCSRQKDPRDIVALMIHEAFHTWGQDDTWAIRHVSEDLASRRGAAYPIHVKPRFYRRKIIKELFTALTVRDPYALNHAAFWQDRLKDCEECGDEECRDEGKWTYYMDILEGTAKYVELTGLASGFADPAGGPAEKDSYLLDYLVGYYNEQWAWEPYRKLDPLAFTIIKDMESYALGPLAGILMDQRGPADWKRRVQDGERPLDVLLEGVSPFAAADDPDLMAQMKEKIDESNKALEPELAAFLDEGRWQDFFWIRCPAQLLGGYLSPAGFVNAAGRDGGVRSFFLFLQAESQDQRVLFKGMTAEMEHETSSFVATVPPSEVLYDPVAGIVSVNDEKLMVQDIPCTRNQDPDGRWWFTLSEP